MRYERRLSPRAFLLAAAPCVCGVAGAVGACTYTLADPRSVPPTPDAGEPGPTTDSALPAPDAPDSSAPDGPSGEGGPGFDAGCPAGANQGAYVVTEGADLYSFEPPSAFSLIGHIDCGDAGTPWDMAIDQNGTAWIVFQNGHLFQVSTTNAQCSPTPYTPDQGGFLLFGMSFARFSPSSSETLYVSDTTYRAIPPIGGHLTSNGVATIDTQTFALTSLGKFIGAESNLGSELTGGNGKLYGFFPNDDAGHPSRLAPLDISAAGVSPDPASVTLPSLGVPTDGDFAFVYRRGGFWLFTAKTANPSTIWHYDPASGLLTGDASAPFPIIGAGVSTCAP